MNLLLAQITDESDENETVCWVEVVDGMRIRTSIPNEKLERLNLNPDDDFLWDCEGDQAYPMPIDRVGEFERERIVKDFLALEEEWNTRLRYIEIFEDD